MSASSFDAALARVLAHEGGYSNHPSDPGGPTKYGITIADYRRYVKPNATAADVEAMTLDAAKTIYRARYWDALACDGLPAGVDYTVFDYGVNSGVARAARVLRRKLTLPESAADVEVSRASRGTDAANLIHAICDERLAFLKSLKTWPVFGNGWSRRVAEVRAAALTMAVQQPRAPAVSRADLATAGAVMAGSGTAAIVAHQAAQAPPDGGVVVCIIIAAALIGIAGWLVWRRWHAAREA
ncbi:MAG: glycoside hydrolase family 108 protein [Pseudolabrys sp.]